MEPEHIVPCRIVVLIGPFRIRLVRTHAAGQPECVAAAQPVREGGDACRYQQAGGYEDMDGYCYGKGRKNSAERVPALVYRINNKQLHAQDAGLVFTGLSVPVTEPGPGVALNIRGKVQRRLYVSVECHHLCILGRVTCKLC